MDGIGGKKISFKCGDGIAGIAEKKSLTRLEFYVKKFNPARQTLT